jgi:ferric-dicitrate binding protein FerR (iron transport regulator)
MLNYDQINELIQKSRRAETTLEEETLLLEWLHADPQHITWLVDSKNLEELLQQWTEYEALSTQEREEKLWERWQQQKKQTRKAIIKSRTVRWLLYAAAVLIVTAGIIVFKALTGPVKKAATSDTARVDSVVPPAPVTDKAVLHLASGKEYLIDDTAKGFLARQDNLEFSKAGGAIYCNWVPGSTASKQVGVHTLTTPRGGRYRLVLPDGSKIWLNAASQLQFSTAATGQNRFVQLEGEAYFEVAADKHRPFIVNANGAEVRVTGTHFNVSAYTGESLSKVALMEGHLSVTSGGEEEIVTPSYAALFAKGGKPKIIRDTNFTKILAWKDKKFIWDNDSLTTALREIERSYDVLVEYEQTPTAIVPYFINDRNKPLHLILSGLMPKGGPVQFEVKGRTIIISDRAALNKYQ